MPGMKPKQKVNIKWSPEFAYAIGLLATDGNLSSDGRHFDLTSKDIDQLKTFLWCLRIHNKIGKKISGYSGKSHFRIQFGDVLFYKFLLRIGLTPAKSKTMGALDIPKRYFFDFLRGSFDGDGTFYSYWDPRWKSSFMFYTVFISASKKHTSWLRHRLRHLLNINGHITHDSNKSTYQLKYAKKESVKLLRRIYYSKHIPALARKRLKIERALGIVGITL